MPTADGHGSHIPPPPPQPQQRVVWNGIFTAPPHVIGRMLPRPNAPFNPNRVFNPPPQNGNGNGGGM